MIHPRRTTTVCGLCCWTTATLLFVFLDSVRALSSSTALAIAKGKQIIKNENVPGLKNGMDYVRLGDSDLVVSNVCMGYVRRMRHAAV